MTKTHAFEGIRKARLAAIAAVGMVSLAGCTAEAPATKSEGTKAPAAGQKGCSGEKGCGGDKGCGQKSCGAKPEEKK